MGVGDQDDHVGEELDGHDRAHVGRAQGDRQLAWQLDAGGAADEFHGDLRVLAYQVERPLVKE